ncbi:hypothetical protein CsSME_00042319 [Camellia sinensis var. sinensis]
MIVISLWGELVPGRVRGCESYPSVPGPKLIGDSISNTILVPGPKLIGDSISNTIPVLAGECTRPRGETTSVAMESFGSCFKCGEEGHFARECSSSTKVRKRNLDFSTPTQKFSKDNRDYVRVGSVPSDPAKAHKRRKGQCEGEFTTPSNSKWRGGWITEDPGDLPHGKAKVHGWVSPATPTNMRNKSYTSITGGHSSSSYSSRKTQKFQCEGEFTMPSNSEWRGGWITEDPGDLPRGKAKVHGWVSPATPTNMRNKSYTSITGGHSSSSYSSRKTEKFHFGASASNGSSKFNQHRYSASRFGNSSRTAKRCKFGGSTFEFLNLVSTSASVQVNY